MRLLALSVEHFRGVRKSRLEFGAGLNVLHGPNELGKSTLAAAIRAALLLQTSSSESKEFVSWNSGGDPKVELVFESEPQRIWRIKKTFGDHPQAFLEESRDGVDFHVEARGRDVDGRLSEILRWGLAPPGGKGRPKGMPVTFLSTALLAEQDEVAAILSRAFSGDSDESGKKRLIEALQAAAEDPLFKSVLHLVQAKVDEAFASSGQRRRGKDSPWVEMQEKIRAAEEDERACREQLQNTTSIECELQDLLTQRLECDAVLAAANERLILAHGEHNQAVQRAEILLRLKRCQDRLLEITSAMQKFSDVKSRQDKLRQVAARLVEQQNEAQLSLTEAAGRVQIAQENIRVRGQEQARERQLKRNTLEKSRAELLSEQVVCNAAVSRMQWIESIAERTRATETAAGQIAKSIGELTIQHAEAVKSLREAEDHEAELAGIAQLIRGNLTKATIDEAEKAIAQIEAWRQQALQHRRAANEIETMLDKSVLPSAAEVDALQRLEHEVQIARAGVGVGLHLSLRPKRELDVSIQRDGQAVERTVAREGLVETSATGEIQLDIDGVAEIRLTGGDKSAREKAERLQARWTAEAHPVLKQTGLASLSDVSAAIKERVRSVEEIHKWRREADALDHRILDQRDWASALTKGQQDLTSTEIGLEGKDRKALNAVALKLRISDLAIAETHLNKLRAQRPKLIERERILEGELIGANTLNSEKQKDLKTAREELLAAQSAVEGYSPALLAPFLDQKSQLANKLVKVEQQLQTLEADIDGDLADARRMLEAAEKEHRTAEARYREVTEELRTTESARSGAEGELKVLAEVVAKLDESAARQAIVATEAELAAVPEPPREVTEAMLVSLRSIADSAQERLRDTEGAITEKRGALKHVGGQVARERLENAQEAMALLRERERDLETDYDAWALLRDTLLEAEQQEGVHLGRVLGGPIMQRFSDLTEGRYQKLDLGPDLETDTISSGGEGRSLDALSVGTRDQLSIIFRLTLAEQLRTVVVLDDQLTQSDAVRMKWVRNLIRQSAANIQIVVFTCHPADYLDPSERKAAKKTASVRSVDLTQVIERSGARP
jgi:AAA domain